MGKRPKATAELQCQCKCGLAFCSSTTPRKRPRGRPRRVRTADEVIASVRRKMKTPRLNAKKGKEKEKEKKKETKTMTASSPPSPPPSPRRLRSATRMRQSSQVEAVSTSPPSKKARQMKKSSPKGSTPTPTRTLRSGAKKAEQPRTRPEPLFGAHHDVFQTGTLSPVSEATVEVDLFPPPPKTPENGEPEANTAFESPPSLHSPEPPPQACTTLRCLTETGSEVVLSATIASNVESPQSQAEEEAEESSSHAQQQNGFLLSPTIQLPSSPPPPPPEQASAAKAASNFDSAPFKLKLLHRIAMNKNFLDPLARSSTPSSSTIHLPLSFPSPSSTTEAQPTTNAPASPIHDPIRAVDQAIAQNSADAADHPMPHLYGEQRLNATFMEDDIPRRSPPPPEPTRPEPTLLTSQAPLVSQRKEEEERRMMGLASTASASLIAGPSPRQNLPTPTTPAPSSEPSSTQTPTHPLHPPIITAFDFLPGIP